MMPLLAMTARTPIGKAYRGVEIDPRTQARRLAAHRSSNAVERCPAPPMMDP